MNPGESGTITQCVTYICNYSLNSIPNCLALNNQTSQAKSLLEACQKVCAKECCSAGPKKNTCPNKLCDNLSS